MNGIQPIVTLRIQLSTINRKIFCKFQGQKTRQQIGKAQRHKNARTQNAIAWGSYPGQAIAVRRAAQERRSKQTWPVTPDSTASKKGSAGHPTKPETPP
jgi:hypothetical protein